MGPDEFSTRPRYETLRPKSDGFRLEATETTRQSRHHKHSAALSERRRKNTVINRLCKRGGNIDIDLFWSIDTILNAPRPDRFAAVVTRVGAQLLFPIAPRPDGSQSKNDSERNRYRTGRRRKRNGAVE